MTFVSKKYLHTYFFWISCYYYLIHVNKVLKVKTEVIYSILHKPVSLESLKNINESIKIILQHKTNCKCISISTMYFSIFNQQ